MSEESKKLRQERAKLVADARALIEASDASDAANNKFDEMMAKADGLKAKIDRIEQAEEAEKATFEDLRNRGRMGGVDPDQVREADAQEMSAMYAWMRRGVGGLSAQQREIYVRRFEQPQNEGAPGGWSVGPHLQNAMGVTPDTAGGALVPMGFYGTVVEAQLAYGGMLSEAMPLDTSTGNPLPIPTDNDTASKGFILGENVQVPDAGQIPIGAVTLNAYVYNSGVMRVSNQLLADSAIDLDTLVGRALGVRNARIMNDHFTFGTGASQPTGVVTAATLGYTAGGASNSGSTVTVSTDDLIELEHSVDPAYRLGAKYMMADPVLKVIKKLKDAVGRPLWLPGLAAKEPDTINGYPYSINQSMAVPAASAKTMIFGNLKNYWVRRVAGVQILRLTERYADFNQVGFMIFQRADGNLIDAGTHPVKYLQQSAT